MFFCFLFVCYPCVCSLAECSSESSVPSLQSTFKKLLLYSFHIEDDLIVPRLFKVCLFVFDCFSHPSSCCCVWSALLVLRPFCLSPTRFALTPTLRVRAIVGVAGRGEARPAACAARASEAEPLGLVVGCGRPSAERRRTVLNNAFMSTFIKRALAAAFRQPPRCADSVLQCMGSTLKRAERPIAAAGSAGAAGRLAGLHFRRQQEADDCAERRRLAVHTVARTPGPNQ